MDEQRIEQALRDGPPDEPAYVPGIADRLRSEAADSTRTVPPSPAPRPGGRPDLEALDPGGVRIRPDSGPRRRPLLLNLAAALALAVGGLLIAQTTFFGPGAVPMPSRVGLSAAATPPLDLLARLQGSGSIRIAVSNGGRQPVSAGASYVGYGTAVANAIAERLHVAGQVSALAPADLAGADWDLALPGGTGAELPGAGISDPYAYWPTWLAAGVASPVTDIASLASARVCVVRGSVGALWLAGDMSGPGSGPPPGAIAVEAASDDDCVAAVTAGRADALLTAMLRADLPARGLHAVVPTPVVLEPWTVVVRPGLDSATLLDAVNEAIGVMRASGRLEVLISSSGWGNQLQSYIKKPL